MVYDSASETSKLRLQKLQTRVAKLVSASGSRENRNYIFKELGGYFFKIENISTSVSWFSNVEMA